VKVSQAKNKTCETKYEMDRGQLIPVSLLDNFMFKTNAFKTNRTITVKQIVTTGASLRLCMIAVSSEIMLLTILTMIILCVTVS